MKQNTGAVAAPTSPSCRAVVKATRSLWALGLGCVSWAMAWAAPVPAVVVPALAPGFVVEWAESEQAPHSIADALAILNGTGPFTVLNRVQQVLLDIDLTDTSAPFAGVDPFFAVRVSGYVSLEADNYTFSGLHDDGLMMVLGGEEIIRFDSDTPPRTSTSAPMTLVAGLYAFTAVSWEQGGGFNLTLRQQQAGRNPTLFAAFNAVPEPSSWLLVGAAFLGMAVGSRRKTG